MVQLFKSWFKGLFSRRPKAQGLYNEPTYSQVERLIAAAGGASSQGGSPYSKPTYAQFERLIEAIKASDAGISAALAGKLDAESAFPAFSEASTYAVGEAVTHEGGLYVCSTAVGTAGPWDAGDWTATTIAALLSRAVPLVVVDDEITIANVPSGTRVQGSDANFADRWPVCVPLAWCYGYVLSAGQTAQGIRLNNGYTAAPDGVGLVVESATQVPYSAELVRTFTAPVTGSYDIELTIAAPDATSNLPRYYDVLVDDATVPSLAYRGSTLDQGEVRITHPGSIALEKGEHRLRIRAVLDRYNAIMAVRGLRVELG